MDAKLDYLAKELWILAWNASVQRASLYREDRDPNPEETRIFRENVVNHLSSQVIPSYSTEAITEEQHYKHIDNLISYANGVDGGVLGQFGYKYGVAQKLLNLALKYYWCLGAIVEPPHCPVDRLIIDKTIYKGKINWTEIAQRSDYQKIIEDIRRLARAQGMSIAMWELSMYSRR